MAAFFLKVVEGTDDNDRPCFRIANADGTGYGDLIRAIESLRLGRTRELYHPARGEFATRQEAVEALGALGEELAARHGGAFEVFHA